MWTNFIGKIPESQLAAWSNCLTWLAALVLPILIGICVLVASKIDSRISALKDKANQQVVDGLKTELNTTHQEAGYAHTLATQLKDREAPWRLTQEQKNKFSAYLKNAPKGKVAIEHSAADGKRSNDFAIEIKNMLEASGYDVWGYMSAFQEASGAPLTGIQIQIKDQQSDIVGGGIQRAFKAIGIEASGAHRTNNNYADDFVVILVGIKP
jgi:hypothetical protein